MLSYQHAYHAGNLADVHKHAALAWMLARLTAKPKPLTYIETHAGRGLYDLSGMEATKTGEAAAGIQRDGLLDSFPPDHPYRQVLAKILAAHGPSAYPGSPLIAARLLRPEDTLILSELHPAEHKALTEALRNSGSHVTRHIHARDGFQIARSVTPPEPRRGLLMVDPSFEVKSDYETIPKFFTDVHRRWNVGILVLWYPLLADNRHRPMLSQLARSFPDGIRHEVRFPPARIGHGMSGSGLFIVNAPYGLHECLASLTQLFDGLSPA